FRILHMIDSLQPGGTAAQLALVAQGLSPAQYEMHVGALENAGPVGDELSSAGIPVTVIGKRWPVDPSAFFRLQRLLTQFQPDLVQTWGEVANRHGRLAAWAAGIKRWVTFADGQRECRPWWN